VLNKLYLAYGGVVLIFFAVATIAGWEFGSPPRETLSPSVRDAPGGYRSFHFWHSGYQGGK
jgi:hypothetical protein